MDFMAIANDAADIILKSLGFVIGIGGGLLFLLGFSKLVDTIICWLFPKTVAKREAEKRQLAAEKATRRSWSFRR